MTGGGKIAQGVYAPLPQTISDTESEEDLHTAIQTTKLPANSQNMDNGNEMVRHYRPLNENEDNNMFPDVMLKDSVPIIKGKSSQMSPLRRVLFAVSILLCIVIVILFLWVLPCNHELICPNVVRSDITTSNWEKIYHGIELKNSINVVSGVTGRSRNLVFLFRGDIMNLDPLQEFPYIPLKGGGLISIVGNTGKVAWYTRLNRVPSDIDCGLIDIDNNGDYDCLVTGKFGLMEAINPVTGTVIWHLHSLDNSKLIFKSVDFPIILPDVNNDGVFDLVTSCSLNGTYHNNIILISGKTGNLIGEPFTVTECKTIHKIVIDKNYLVSYICQNVTFKESYINLHELYRKITNKSIDFSKKIEPIKQHLVFGQKRDTQSQRNIYSVHNRKLIVQNDGKCPGNCNVTVQLIDMQSGKENLTWSHTGTNMYGMVPATLIFNDTETNRAALKGHISGFILKFWQWNVQNKYKHEKFLVTNHSRKMFRSVLDDWVTKQNSWPNVRNRRNIPNFKRSNKATNVSVQLLTERVVLITFNSTDLHIVNASQNEITQLCTNVNRIVDCQPDLNYQENSVLIADLDQDGAQELISYLSTYVNVEEYNEGNSESLWQLQSIVKVVRLEAELPKLYEAVSRY